MQDVGVAFVSLTEAFDLTTSTGRALAGMVAVFAEFEREIRRERILAGIEQAVTGDAGDENARLDGAVLLGCEAGATSPALPIRRTPPRIVE